MPHETLTITVAAPVDLAEWQEYVDRHPNARAMHHAGWYGVLHDAFGVKLRFFMAKDAGGHVRGVMPAYSSRSVLMPPHLTTLDDGALCDDGEAEYALVSAALALVPQTGARYFLLRTAQHSRSCSEASATRATVRRVIDTQQSAQALFESLNSYVRRDVRRAEKRGYTVFTDERLEHLDGAFYEEYARQMHTLGTPVMGRAMMSALKRHLGAARLRLYMIRHDEHMVGGLLSAVAPAGWTALYAAVQPKASLDYANHLLYWHAIRDAATSGAKELDLGRNTPGSGVHKFKEKWPGVDREVEHYFFGSGSNLSAYSALHTGQTLRQRVWKRLPLVLASAIGPVLRRQLPFG